MDDPSETSDPSPDAFPSKLSVDQIGKVNAWIADKLGGQARDCSTCGKNDWVLLDHLVAPVHTNGSTTYLTGGGTYPMFMLVCTNCGHTQFINAIAAGVVERLPK